MVWPEPFIFELGFGSLHRGHGNIDFIITPIGIVIAIISLQE